MFYNMKHPTSIPNQYHVPIPCHIPFRTMGLHRFCRPHVQHIYLGVQIEGSKLGSEENEWAWGMHTQHSQLTTWTMLYYFQAPHRTGFADPSIHSLSKEAPIGHLHYHHCTFNFNSPFFGYGFHRCSSCLCILECSGNSGTLQMHHSPHRGPMHTITMNLTWESLFAMPHPIVAFASSLRGARRYPW